jgi:hypothetical protein
MWDWVIRAKRVTNLLPVLETVLSGFKYQSKVEKPVLAAETIEVD